MKMRTGFGDVIVWRNGNDPEVVFSPLVVEQVVYARSKCTSAVETSEVLRVLADIDVSPEQVDHITREVRNNAENRGPK